MVKIQSAKPNSGYKYLREDHYCLVAQHENDGHNQISIQGLRVSKFVPLGNKKREIT